MTTVHRHTIDHPQLILVTGIMAAGKSTVAQRLAERLPNSVHLRGDAFRRMIVNGRAEMTRELAAAAAEQLRLCYCHAANAVALYLRAKFSVVYQDVILGHRLMEAVQSSINLTRCTSSSCALRRPWLQDVKRGGAKRAIAA